MCFGGKSNDGPVDPGTYSEWLKAKIAKARTAGEEYNESPESRKEYEKDLEAYNKTKETAEPTIEESQEEQKAEVKEQKKSEAQKTAEVKEEAMEEKIATVTAPVSTLEKDAPQVKRQLELSQDIEAPSKPVKKPKAYQDIESPLKQAAAKAIATEPMVAEPMGTKAMVEKTEESTPEGSLIKKRKQKQMDLISGLSKKRSKARGRRSLITGLSGGGIGYYSRYFT